MSNITATRKSPQPVVRNELVDEKIARLLERVARISDFVAPDGDDGESVPRSDFSDLLRADLRTYFEDEIIPAVPSSGNGLIDETELRHELAKKALIGLKLSVLRQGAKELGVSARGSSEDVATSVARSLGWDPDQVAEFVLAHEEEPSEEHAHSVRIFPLEPEAVQTADEIEAGVTQVLGRYIRVGVARWYVFSDLSRTEDGVRIFGKYMSYETGLDEGEDGSVGIVSQRKLVEVSAEISTSKKVVQVDRTSAAAAKAAVFASTAVLSHPILGYIPNSGSGADRIDGRVHGSSEFLLDLLENRLIDAGVNRVNITVARFMFDDGDDEPSGTRPRLRAVRFDGDHILDSVQACKFIVDDGRPFGNVSFRLYIDSQTNVFQGQRRESSFPVKIALESDHVQVTTGLGDDPIESVRVHSIVKSAVCAEILYGRSENGLSDLIARITARARAGLPSQTPTILTSGKDRSRK